MKVARYYAEFMVKEYRDNDGTPETIPRVQLMTTGDSEKDAEKRLMELLGYMRVMPRKADD